MSDQRPAAKLRRQNGYFTSPEVAGKLAIPRRTFSDLVRRGLLPAPTVLIGRRRYYSRNAVEEMERRYRKEQ